MDDREVIARAEAAFDGANWNALSFNETPSGETPDEMRLGYAERADAILAHLEASGRAIVPVEATEAMVLASAKILAAQETCAAWGDLSPVAQRDYIACAKQMLSAAMIAAAKDQTDD